LLLASCNSEQQSILDEMPPLYPAPQIVALNTEEGYIINPVTGDIIQPIVNAFGDTIITGVPIPVKGIVINPDGVAKPKKNLVGKPEVVPTNMNVHKIPNTLTVIPVNKDSLKTFTPGVDTSSFVLVNTTGDTIPTGVPIPVIGKVVPCIYPQPVKSSPPRMNENAIVNMKYLDVEQGMMSYNIEAILEDRHGNIWLGSGFGGVSKYNGETFTHFTEKEGLSNNAISSILEDSQGNLWFGTVAWSTTEGGGVIKYNGETFTHFTEKEGLISNNITSILEDSQGYLWFSTSSGVSMYDGESFTHFTEKEGLSDNYIMSIIEDSQGNLWFGTYGGVIMYNGETFTHFTEKEGLSHNWTNSIMEDSQGNLWFGTYGGVSMYNGETFTHFTEKEGLISNDVWTILEDSQGDLWFATQGSGVSKFNGETFTHFTEKEDLSDNFVNSILEDSRGNLWFGTFDGGVSIYNGSFMHFTEKEGLSQNWIRYILEDNKGNLWLGSGFGGVSKYNGETFMRFTEKEGLSNYVVSILEDRHDNLWFGTNDGAIMYNGNTYTNFTEKEGLISDNINFILEDHHGNLWFATFGGVSMYDGETFTNYTEKEGLISNDITTILEDSQYNLWFGTWDCGVSMYDGETLTHYTEKEGLSNNAVSSIMEDSHGNLWFGSSYGVSMYNGVTFTHFTEKQGLSHNWTSSIMEDRDGNIWLGTERGLNHLVFSPKSVSGMTDDSVNISFYNPIIHTYDRQYGMKGRNFDRYSVFLDSKNRIWWGSRTGLTMLDMNNFKVPSAPPAIQLNRIEINEKFIDYRNLKDSAGIEMDFSGVAKFYNYPLNLKLPYKNNHLTFHFSAIDWSEPQKIRYSYKMEELNNNWTNPISEAKADYLSLPYGTYTFKVRAIGESQKWSEPFEYTFIINPPWWHTWLARTFYGIASLLLIIGIVRWRTAKLKQRQKELEFEVANATLEIRSQKEEVETQRDEIETQRDEIEAQRDQLEIQRDVVLAQKEEITDSIKYAQRIQSAVLPHQEYLDAVMPEYFVLFKPRDIVSGDFYWIKQIKNYLIIVAADCTGHGVPGAFMSMLGIAFLNELIGKGRFDKPSKILNQLRKQVKETLSQEGKAHEQQDGMDMALAIIDNNSKELQFAGANNPLYLISNKKVIHDSDIEQYTSVDNEEFQLFELKGDKQPIGVYWTETNFTTKKIQLKKGDSIYLFSDGFVDQKGGPKNKKFLSTNFKRSLLEIQTLSMKEQKKNLDSTVENWRSGFEQLDDILVIGLRIN